MALGARELILILRATNQASGPIRQVGRDLRSLGSGGVRSLGQMSAAQQRVARNWHTVGMGSAILRDTGRSARIMGIAAGAGLGFAAKNAADFSTQVTLAATQTGKLDSNLGRTTNTIQKNATVIEQGILKQMQKFPATQEDMAKAAYEIFSSTDLGIQSVGQGMKLLTLFNKASVAGQTDLNEVTKTGITVMQGFKLGVKDMPAIMNRSFAAVRFGRMTFQEFTQSLNQLVPSAIGANQSFDTIAGTMAALTRRMPNVRMAGTALARLMELFGRKKFVDGAKKFGVNVTDGIGKIRPLPNIIQDLRAAIDKLPLKERANMVRNLFKELSNTEGTIQARRALQHLLDAPKDYSRILGLVVNDQNEFNRSLKSMEQTTGVRWGVLTNQLRAFFLLIGALALPVIIQLMKPLQQLFKWFQGLDTETKGQMVRWVALGAAIAIVGGTIASVVGNIGTLIAPFKAFGGSLTMLLGTIGLVAAALLILAGQGDLVKMAFEGIFDSATSSARNLAIAISALFLVMTRMSSMASAGTGIFAMFGGGKRRAGDARAGLQAIKEQASAARETARATQIANAEMAAMTAAGISGGRRGGRFVGKAEIAGIKEAAAATTKMSRAGFALKGLLAGAAGAAMLIPSPLWIAAAATVAIGGAAYLVHRHLQAAADRAKALAEAQKQFRDFAQAPRRAAEGLASFGLDVREADRAAIAVRAVDQNIKQLQQSLRGATAAQRPAIMDQIKTAYLDRADALDRLATANRTANESFGQTSVFIKAAASSLARMHDQEGRLANMQKQRAVLQKQLDVTKIPAGIGPLLSQANALDTRIAGLKISIQALGAETSKSMLVLRGGFTKAVNDLARAKIVPKAPQQMIDDLLRTFVTLRQRTPTLQEIKLALDPASVGKLDADVRAMLQRIQSQRQLKIDVAKGRQFAIDSRQIQKAVPKKVADPFKLPVGLVPPKNTKKVKQQIDATFRVVSKQKVTVIPPPPGALLAVGSAITAGIQAGIHPVHMTVVKDFINGTVGNFEKAGQGGSPMMLFAKKVGIPIIQGIIVGILSKAGEAGDAAALAVDAITGKSVAAMTKNMQKQSKTLAQMNNNLQTLVNRGVPLRLIEQLAQLGQEGAGQIAKLASGSKAELAKFVAAWRGAQSQVNQSARFNWTRLTEFVNAGSQKLLELYNTARDTLRAFVFGGLNDIAVLAGSISDSVGNAFGELFKGPMNISDHIGTAFDDAMTSYRSSSADLQQQMQDLQKRQADTISEFMKRRRDELQQQFGQLFSGPILSGGFAAGSIRDLIADLEGQLKAFKEWRRNLDTLTARGVPKTLMKELEALGPDASDNLALLVSGTDAELAKYVSTWEGAQGAIETVTQATFMDMEGFAAAMEEIAQQMADTMKKMSELQAPKRADFAMILADLQAQKAAWLDFNTTLTNLRDKGVPAALLAELAKLGVDGIDILRLFNTASAEQLAQYVATWTATQAAIKTAKKEWVDAISPQEILTGLQAQVDALATWEGALNSLIAKGLPAKIVQQLRELGPDASALIQGINTMSAPELAKFVTLWTGAQKDIDKDAKVWIDAQIALWSEHGKSIAAGIIAGVMSEQGQLLTFFRNLFKALLDEARKQVKPGSPSKVYYGLGQSIVQGFQAGISSMTPELGMPGSGSINGAFGGRSGPGINMTVNAQHSESLQSTLERTAFRMRTRRVG